jgi:hypothetical protein
MAKTEFHNAAYRDDAAQQNPPSAKTVIHDAE